MMQDRCSRRCCNRPAVITTRDHDDFIVYLCASCALHAEMTDTLLAQPAPGVVNKPGGTK